MQREIRGDAITTERWSKDDMELLGDERGGFRHYYARSVIDTLYDNEIITEAQKDYGLAYWRLMECAFSFLGVRENPAYGESPDENDFDHSLQMTIGHAADMFVILTRRIIPRYRKAIAATCAPACENAPLAIVWAFGDATITQAYDALETAFPKARQELEARIAEQEKNEQGKQKPLDALRENRHY